MRPVIRRLPGLSTESIDWVFSVFLPVLDTASGSSVERKVHLEHGDPATITGEKILSAPTYLDIHEHRRSSSTMKRHHIHLPHGLL